MSGRQQNLDDYRRSVDRFRWDVSEVFNFGRDMAEYSERTG
ncbi:MAG: hypothetical protein ACYS0F_04710 [Planctomycetota bacterium]|jgi:hypothetical protein